VRLIDGSRISAVISTAAVVVIYGLQAASTLLAPFLFAVFVATISLSRRSVT